MKIKPIKLHINDLDAVVNFTVDKLEFDYENHTKSMSILIKESFHLRTMSGQMETVVFKMKDNCVYIDILAGGGGKGLLNLDFGSENLSVSSILNVLQEFATERNVEMEFVDSLNI